MLFTSCFAFVVVLPNESSNQSCYFGDFDFLPSPMSSMSNPDDGIYDVTTMYDFDSVL